MTIYTREMLGWPTAREMHLTPATADAGLVLHWDGGVAKLSGKPHSKCVEYWQGVRVFHMKATRLGGRGWRDIGYSYGVCPHGDEFAGRTYGYEQAAQPGGNTTWTSCTLMLGPGELPTDVQIEGVRRLRARLMVKGLHASMRGHSQFISTDCPGPIIRALITNGTFTRDIVDSVAEITVKKSAVIKFQTAHGLNGDGIVGPNTWAELVKGGE